MSASIRTESIALSLPSLRRSSRMVQRSLIVYRHIWTVIVSGFFEPVFYLFGVGIGLGALVPDIDGVSYPAFVMPGLLAWSCVNGALSDGMFNIFFKLHFQKVYDGVLATPMRVPDIAFGEMLWTMVRSSLYAAAFLVVVLVTGWVIGQPLLLSAWRCWRCPQPYSSRPRSRRSLCAPPAFSARSRILIS